MLCLQPCVTSFPFKDSGNPAQLLLWCQILFQARGPAGGQASSLGSTVPPASVPVPTPTPKVQAQPPQGHFSSLPLSDENLGVSLFQGTDRQIPGF